MVNKLKQGNIPTVGLIATLLVAVTVPICLWLFSNLDRLAHPNQGVKTLSKEVNVEARVGEYLINRLAGWTSPFAEVNLLSPNLTRKTLADENGEFVFYNIPITSKMTDLCLISLDVNQLPSAPTCIAPPPANMDIDVINVLLSPSISVDSPVISPNQTVRALGMTYPNSSVNVYLYSVNDTIYGWLKAQLLNLNFKIPDLVIRLINLAQTADQITIIAQKQLALVKPALAFGLPKYQTESNSDGYFEFSLPAGTQAYNRFYVAAALNINTGAVNRHPTPATGIRLAPKTNSTTESKDDFLPQTGYSAAAAEPEELVEIDIRESPKSNSLYFRSLGLLSNAFYQLFRFFNQAILFFWELNKSALGLISIEILIVCGLILFILIRKLREDNHRFDEYRK